MPYIEHIVATAGRKNTFEYYEDVLIKGTVQYVL